VRMTTGLELGPFNPAPDEAHLEAMLQHAREFLSGPALFVQR
jgi:hypothetical protein